MLLRQLQEGALRLAADLALVRAAHHRGDAGAETSYEGAFLRHAEIARTETLDAVQEEPLATPALVRFVRETQALAAVAGKLDRARALEIGERVGEAEQLPTSTALVRLRGTSASTRRAELAKGIEETVKRRSSLNNEIADQINERLGLPRPEAGNLGREILARTREMYADALNDELRKIEGIRPGAMRWSDVERVARASHLDGVLPTTSSIVDLERFALRMGLEPRAGGRIKHDVADHPLRRLRPLVVVTTGTEDCVIVLRPGGSHPDSAGFLHALGHALHRSHTSADLPVEARRLGDCAISETYALLFERLLCSRIFLRKVLRLSPNDTEKVARTSGALGLLSLRREAVLLVAEADAPASSKNGAKHYQGLWSSELRAETAAVLYGVERTLLDRSCVRLRAALAESRLRNTLRDRFDEDWFHNPRAGAFLKQLFSEGQSTTVEAMTREVTGAAAAAGDLTRWLGEALG